MSIEKKRMDVVCGIIVENGKVLAARRGPDANRAGKWEFPGGKVKRDENPAHAIVREIREELDLSVSVVRKLPVLTHHYPDVIIRLIPFICEIMDGNIHLTDHDAYAWIPENSIFQYDWSEADRDLVILIWNSTKHPDDPIV